MNNTLLMTWIPLTFEFFIILSLVLFFIDNKRSQDYTAQKQWKHYWKEFAIQQSTSDGMPRGRKKGVSGTYAGYETGACKSAIHWLE